jgi:hypothetical protein
VLLPALVKGMGREERCEMLTRRLGIEPVPAYSDCTVIGAPDDLPDGEYIVEFENICAVTTCRQGVWATFNPPFKSVEEPEALLD